MSRAMLHLWNQHPLRPGTTEDLITRSNESLYVARILNALERDGWAVDYTSHEEDGSEWLWTAEVDCETPREAEERCSRSNPRRWGTLLFVTGSGLEMQSHTIW